MSRESSAKITLMIDIEYVLGGIRRRKALPAPQERRRIRQAGGLTQAEVAALIGVDRSTVSRWEQKNRTPRGSLDRYLDLLDRIKEAT